MTFCLRRPRSNFLDGIGGCVDRVQCRIVESKTRRRLSAFVATACLAHSKGAPEPRHGVSPVERFAFPTPAYVRETVASALPNEGSHRPDVAARSRHVGRWKLQTPSPP